MYLTHMARCSKHQSHDAWRDFCCEHSQLAFIEDHRATCGFDNVESKSAVHHG